MDEDWVRQFDNSQQVYYWHNTVTGETSWGDEEEVQSEEGVEEVPAPDEWREVKIIRYRGGSIAFKHWALFVKDHGLETGTLYHIMGERGRYRFEVKRNDPERSETIVDQYKVGYVDTDRLEELAEFARRKKIHNEDMSWGCQDWTWTLMEELGKEGILEQPEEFEERRNQLWAVKGPHH